MEEDELVEEATLTFEQYQAIEDELEILGQRLEDKKSTLQDVLAARYNALLPTLYPEEGTRPDNFYPGWWRRINAEVTGENVHLTLSYHYSCGWEDEEVKIPFKVFFSEEEK